MPPKGKKKSPQRGKATKKNRGKSDFIKVEIKVEDGKRKTAPEKNDEKPSCNVCGRNFAKTYLKIHEKKCSSPEVVALDESVVPRKAVFSCKKCPKKFRFKKSFVKHLLCEHSKTPGSLKCSQCNVVCPNQSTLDEHMQKVHQRDIFECEYCQKQFVRQTHVMRHMAQTGCGGTSVVYPCAICQAKFTRKDNLMVHLRMKHILKNEYKCKECSYSTGKLSKLIIHQNKVHKGESIFECDHCGRVTSSRVAMTKHLEIHGEKKFSCDVCGYRTFTIEVMRRHVLTHVPDKPHRCNVCGRSYIQRVQLLKHMEKHDGLPCAVCGKSYPNKHSLLIHERDHISGLGNKCHIENCEQSKTVFKTKEELHQHLSLHTTGKIYRCEVCNKTFRTEANMRRHVSTHTLDRPRRCMYCVAARAYVRGEQLVKHVRKQHPTVFMDHLAHVRRVLGAEVSVGRVKKSELESILNVMDAESDRILSNYGEGVLYGGMQEMDDQPNNNAAPAKDEDSPLMSEPELERCLGLLLEQLIDKDMLQCFGWPEENIDVVLEKVLSQCGARVADRERWSRVQVLRENAKHLFLRVVEDANIARMLATHTIDQVIRHILNNVGEDDEQPKQEQDEDADENDEDEQNETNDSVQVTKNDEDDVGKITSQSKEVPAVEISVDNNEEEVETEEENQTDAGGEAECVAEVESGEDKEKKVLLNL